MIYHLLRLLKDHLTEQTATFEMGDAIGAFERSHLLGLAFQGLNANNLVYDLVKENGKALLEM